MYCGVERGDHGQTPRARRGGPIAARGLTEEGNRAFHPTRAAERPPGRTTSTRTSSTNPPPRSEGGGDDEDREDTSTVAEDQQRARRGRPRPSPPTRPPRMMQQLGGAEAASRGERGRSRAGGGRQRGPEAEGQRVDLLAGIPTSAQLSGSGHRPDRLAQKGPGEEQGAARPAIDDGDEEYAMRLRRQANS